MFLNTEIILLMDGAIEEVTSPSQIHHGLKNK